MQLDLILVLLRRWVANLGLFVATLFSSTGNAQTRPASSPPQNSPQKPDSRSIADHLYPSVGAFCGLGVSTSPSATKPTVGCGVGMNLFLTPLIFTEVGVMGPQANRSAVSGYLSIDANLPLAKGTSPAVPLVLLGYSRLFETGHAVDYGLGLILPRPWKPDADMRLELRDYWTFANPTQHNVMLRIGLITLAAD